MNRSFEMEKQTWIPEVSSKVFPFIPSFDVCVCLTGFGRLFYKCDSARRLDCDVGALADAGDAGDVAVCERLGCGSQLPRIFLKDAKAAKKDPAIRKWAAVSSRKIYQVNLCHLYLRNQSNFLYPIGWYCLEHTTSTHHVLVMVWLESWFSL